MIGTVALSVLGGVVFLAAFGRYSALGSLGEWERLLGPARRRMLEELAQDLTLDTLLAERAHGKALRERDRDQVNESIRLLELAGGVIEEAIPNRLERLRALATICRMATALVPMPALVPSNFRLAEIVTLTGAARLLHAVLVGTHERFALRLSVLGASYRLVRRVVRRSTAEIRSCPRAAVPWTAFDCGLSDMKALDRAHIESLRLLLLAVVEPQDPPSAAPLETEVATERSEVQL